MPPARVFSSQAAFTQAFNDGERVTGVRHESPQALWIVAGRVAWHASHFDITVAALAAAVDG